MKIYLAARYSRIAELNGFRRELEELGHQVTSRWLQGGHEITREGSAEAHQSERVRFALEDWEDMVSADMVISFTEAPRTTKTRGGRHVEFGGAIALGKQCVVIGHRENVFHCLPQVEFHDSWADFMARHRSALEAA